MPEGIPYSSSNVVVGTGLDLNYVGDFVFAYSGTFPASTSEQTIMDAVSPGHLIIGEFQYNQPTAPDSPQNDETSAVQIKFNGVTISIMRVVEGTGYGAFATQKVIIPPYTKIVATCESTDNQAAMLSTLTFVGKRYK